jgi:hypothetical protein
MTPGLMRDMSREVRREATEGAKKSVAAAKETMKSRASQLGALYDDVKASTSASDAGNKIRTAIKHADQAGWSLTTSNILLVPIAIA